MIKAIQMPMDTDTIYLSFGLKGTVADRKQWVTDLNKLSSLIKSLKLILKI